MKLFECQNCGQPLYFENTRCESCGLSLGYMPEREVVTALHPEGESWARVGGADSPLPLLPGQCREWRVQLVDPG